MLHVEETNCPNGTDWAMPENRFPELPEFAALKDLEILGGKGPILLTREVNHCQAPEDPLIYF